MVVIREHLEERSNMRSEVQKRFNQIFFKHHIPVNNLAQGIYE